VGIDQSGGLEVEPGEDEAVHVGKIPWFMGMMFSRARSAPKEVPDENPELKACQEFLLDETQHYSHFDGGQLMYAIDIAGQGEDFVF